MPIYQFVCQACQAPYSELLFGAEQPTCPKCQSHTAEKQFSTFSSPRGGTAPTPFVGSDGAFASGPCGSCGDPRGPGSCAS